MLFSLYMCICNNYTRSQWRRFGLAIKLFCCVCWASNNAHVWCVEFYRSVSHTMCVLPSITRAKSTHTHNMCYSRRRPFLICPRHCSIIFASNKILRPFPRHRAASGRSAKKRYRYTSRCFCTLCVVYAIRHRGAYCRTRYRLIVNVFACLIIDYGLEI